MIEDLPKRFTEKIKFNDSCWLWTAAKDKDGYGFFSVNGKQTKAHRFSFAHYNGEIPTGMIVCHKCDTPSCVNPDHLFLGTHKINLDDMRSKGREHYASG